MIEIRKKFLFILLQERQFKFSQKFMQENILLIRNYIEKKYKKKFRTELPKKLICLLESEFRKLTYAYKKAKGGKQRADFYKNIENEIIQFEMDNLPLTILI
jgi:hypothetical protein